MKRRVYCLAVMESLSPVGSLESNRATLTKNLSNDCCFLENRLNCEYVTLSRQTSSNRIAKHRSFIKLKFLQNFCSSCKTLADQVARNPRFYCTHKTDILWGMCNALELHSTTLCYCRRVNNRNHMWYNGYIRVNPRMTKWRDARSHYLEANFSISR
jgi:hypothetical protein